jgi:hypothetical protein
VRALRVSQKRSILTPASTPDGSIALDSRTEQRLAGSQEKGSFEIPLNSTGIFHWHIPLALALPFRSTISCE